MRKLLVLLFFSSLLSAQTKTTVTGVVQDSTGVLATSGTVVFTLQPQNNGIIYFVTGTGILAPQIGTCGIDVSGNIKSLANLSNPCQVWGTDIIQPANLTYQVSFFPNGNFSNVVGQQCITGTTYDLSNPKFCPVIRPTPQGATVITTPVQNNLIPSADTVFALGSASNRYANVFAANGTFTNLNLINNLTVPGLTTLNGGTLNGTYAGNPTLSGNVSVGGTLGVTGTSTLANVTLGATNTISTSNVKQVSATTGFNILDNNGIGHFGIAGVAPFQNTFVEGNGSGSVFLGSAAKTNVADNTGTITTAGSVTLQTTSQTLPATIANDTSGGVTTTSNGGKSLQWNNSGVLIVNPASTSSGAALTVGGTSASTGGMSIFVGASGSATETVANYPADGLSGALRIQALSIRTPSAGLLTGTQNFGITNAGVVTGATLVSPIINTGVANNGTGFQHKRGVTGCTTAASLNAVCSTTITWNTAFVDANYTVVGCTGNGVGAGIPVLQVFGSKVAASISVQTLAASAAAAQFSTIECTAVHD